MSGSAVQNDSESRGEVHTAHIFIILDPTLEYNPQPHETRRLTRSFDDFVRVGNTVDFAPSTQGRRGAPVSLIPPTADLETRATEKRGEFLKFTFSPLFPL
jgi:hypothetical protein